MIIVVDPVYNPNFVEDSEINSGTKLAKGVTLAKFLGAYGDRTPFTFITTGSERKALARQLYLHAQLYNSINGNAELFNDVRLIISESVYRPGPLETVGGDNLKKQDGRMVVYQVVGQDGTIDHEKTFDVAEFWKDYMFYDKITLDYDTLNPDGSMTSQIVVEMPTIDESFEAKFGLNVDTVYNGAIISSGELVEILE